MATLKEILGLNIQVLDDDPVAAGAVWASGGDLNEVKAGLGGAGIQTANISIGGIVTNAPAAGTANTESYNGTSWTEVNNLNNDREITNGVGLYTAALCIGNDPPYSAAVESWDGTNWTNGTNLPAPRAYGAAFGTQTAAIYTGGYTDGDSPVSGSTLYWNGSSWTETGDLNTTRLGLSSSTNGTYTAAIVFGGGSNKNTESWNGSTWTEVNDLISAAPNSTGGGTQTSAFSAKGGVSVTTQTWDGTNWASAADAATAANYSNKGGGGASSAAGLVFGGSNAPGFTTPTFITSTEEFTEPPITATIQQEGQLYFKGGALKGFERAAGVPAGTWASSGSLNTARRVYDSMNGTQSASKAISGFTPPDNSSTSVEDYNGTSWTETTEVNTARYSGAAAGNTSASSILFGGYIPSPPSYVTNTETWNGSSWTEVNELNTARGNLGGNGSQTSALTYGGQPITGKTESWDGTSWTEVSDLNRTRHDMAATGASNTSALAAGGQYPPNQRGDQVETWNGSSWTEVNELNTGREQVGGSGTKDLAIAFGGTPNGSTFIGNTEAWNGSSWTEISDLATGRSTLGSSGSAATGLGAGGHTPSLSAATEEFTAAITNTTVTSS